MKTEISFCAIGAIDGRGCEETPEPIAEDNRDTEPRQRALFQKQEENN